MNLQERLAQVKLLAMDWDGIFTDNHVWTFADGSEAIRTSRAEGIGLERLRNLGVRLVVITGEPEGVVDVRCKKLGLEVCHAVGGITKAGILNEIATDYRRAVPYEQIAYIGNDMNDLDCLKAVGVPIVPNDAAKSLLDAWGRWWARPAAASEVFMTDHNGGDGAVREACDKIADAIEAPHPDWQRIAEALG